MFAVCGLPVTVMAAATSRLRVGKGLLLRQRSPAVSGTKKRQLFTFEAAPQTRHHSPTAQPCMSVVGRLIHVGSGLDQFADYGKVVLLCQNGHFPVVRELIQAGAVVDKAKDSGCNPVPSGSLLGYLLHAFTLIFARWIHPATS